MANVTPSAVLPINTQQWAVSNQVSAPNPTYSGTFIPTLWSGKLAKKFYNTTIFGEIANTDWQGEIANLGDTVIINTIPTLSTKEYKVGMQLEYEVPSPETIQLKIDKARYFGVNVNDVMEFQSKPNLMNMFTDDASTQMKLYIDQDVIKSTFFKGGVLNTSANGKGAVWEKNCGANAGAVSGAYNLGTDSAPVSLTAENILSYITMMSTVMDEANVPEEGRYLVITPKERQILMMSNLAQAQFMGDPKSVLRNGKIGSIDRFTIYVSNQLPRAAATQNWDGTHGSSEAKRHLIFAGHKSGISFASQITKMESLQNPNDFGKLVRGLQVWGSAVTQGQVLVPMIVADA